MNDNETVNELKRLSRRLESFGKTIDLIFKDRDILEDVLTRLTAVEAALNLNRASQTQAVKDTRADINEVKDVVEAKVGEVTNTMDEKTVIVKTKHPNMMQKIINKIEGK